MRPLARQIESTQYGMRTSGQSRARIVAVQRSEILANSLSLYATICVFRFHCEPGDSKFDIYPISCELATPGHMDLQLKSLKNALCRRTQVALVLITVVSPLSSAGLYAADGGADVFAAVDAISRLHQLSPIFTDPDRRRGMSLQQRKATEIEASKQLQRVPLELLIPQIEKYAVASEQQVRSFDNPREFVTRLSEVAMNGIITPPNPEVPTHGVVAFKALASHAGNTRVFRGPTGKILPCLIRRPMTIRGCW